MQNGEPMGVCFVIQPFDGADFDKRYEEVLKPAIESLGLKSYRVDNDPSANVIINTITETIRTADVCIADISTDKPNVWFEIGYALSVHDEIALICNTQYRDRLPFDIQHRNVIFYTVGSPSAFSKLEDDVTKRIKAILGKRKPQAKSDTTDLSTYRDESTMSQDEFIVFTAVLQRENAQGDESCFPYILRDHCLNNGLNDFSMSVAINRLITKKLLQRTTDHRNYDYYETTETGRQWLANNADSIPVEFICDMSDSGGKSIQTQPDDYSKDIPF